MAKGPTASLTSEEWLHQLGDSHPEVLLPGYWTNIANNAKQWAEEVSVGPYWTDAGKNLDQWRTEYNAKYGSQLLARPGLPLFSSKPEASIREKLFRYCKNNSKYIAKAISKSSPALPRLGDLVRTRVSCQYIDGVEFLGERMYRLAETMGLQPKIKREGRIEGYFAQHLIIEHDVIFRFAGGTTLAKVRCEIQIATQMATHMWTSVHDIYEASRSAGDNPELWQWKPDDPRFISNQLGHMIHLADGLLVQLRKSSKKF